MIERQFLLEDQRDFASLSGDVNPVHLDPLYARRTLFGKAVVHGVHLLLWGIESWLAEVSEPIQLLNVRADFWKAVGINEPITCSWETNSKGKTTISIFSENVLQAQCSAVSIPCTSLAEPELPPPFVKKCAEISCTELSEKGGTIPLALDSEQLKKLFPRLAAQVPHWQTATLLGTTNLVGMECPGLHSLFSRLKITFDSQPCTDFQWKVESFDEASKMLTISLNSEKSVTGELIAFHRGTPVKQISFADVQKRVDPTEFSSERVWIIGGSRGLGEVTAKIFAAGGAEVILTYARGKDDAEKIVREITEQKGTADFTPLNVLDADSLRSVEKMWAENPPTLLCYFATPFIFSATPNLFSEQLFEQFCRFYVTGFNRITTSSIRFGVRKIFYPSSIAVDELPDNMGEYASAKIAGEMLCRFLEKSHPDVVFHLFRFPRMETDQTQSLAAVDNISPFDICLDQIRCLCNTYQNHS